MKMKFSTQSSIFNSGFLIGLSVFLFAVFLLALGELATANPYGRGRVFSPRPLGGQCVTLRGPIVILSTSADIAFVDTAPAAFNSQADEFLISWDQLIGT